MRIIPTTRFGTLTIAADRVINFPKGLLGFPDRKAFALLEPGDDACVFWLQSADDPALAFVVTDPCFWIEEYSAPIQQEQFAALGLETLADAQVFVIMNKIDGNLTGNLLGPLVVNSQTRLGVQIVIKDKRWSTRHPLVKVGTVAAGGAQ